MKKLFSFFSGCGFLDLGFEKAGYEVVFVNEINPSFMNAYQYARRAEATPAYGFHNADVNQFLGSDMLQSCMEDARSDGSLVGFIGGPPCPDFSIAGKGRGRDGINGKLSSSYVALIAEMKPDFFLFENVKGLWKTKRHREYFEELKHILQDAGYITTERLVNALEYGAPQDRDRILLFGIHKSLIQSEGMKSDKELSEFPWDAYRKYHADEVKSMPWPQSDAFCADVALECPCGIPYELTAEYWFQKNDVENHPNAKDYFLPRAGLSKMKVIQEGDTNKKSYKRLHRWRYSPTVAYGNNEVHLHPYKERRLSVAEALALQSLPKEFELPADMSLTDKFKTIGNGVPFLLAYGMAKTIDDFLNSLNL